MTEQQDGIDPRVEPFARFMQARDARTFDVQDTNGDFQTWDGIGEMGREEYLKDAAAYVAALDIIAPPSIADMAPDADAVNRLPAQSVVADADGYVFLVEAEFIGGDVCLRGIEGMGFGTSCSGMRYPATVLRRGDPSTIRDVTPPTASPEEDR